MRKIKRGLCILLAAICLCTVMTAGIAIAAPSTAQAYTGERIQMSDGKTYIECVYSITKLEWNDFYQAKFRVTHEYFYYVTRFGTVSVYRYPWHRETWTAINSRWKGTYVYWDEN